MQKLTNAKLSESNLHEITHFGIRAAIGAIFIAHGMFKFTPAFAEMLPNMGLPAEIAIVIALAELVSGILLIVGVLTRISASILSIVMLGAIFMVKQASSLTGEGGYELDLILLAGCLTIIAIGPGKISISYMAKKIPRILQ